MNAIEFFAYKNPSLFPLPRHEAKRLLINALEPIEETLNLNQLFSYHAALVFLSFDNKRAPETAKVYAKAIKENKCIYDFIPSKLATLTGF
jgi:hypothetical protein